MKASLAGLAALLSLAAGPALAADPFITLTPSGSGTSEAWWLAPMESRPTGQSVAGVPLDRINAALDETEARWCAADALTAASFAAADPALRAEMTAYLANAGELFRATMTVNRRELQAVVGNFRSCAGEIAPFALLIDQRAHVPQVVFVRMFTDWTPFITVRRSGADLVFGSCLECDHGEVLAYDRGARRFYWRSEGP
jgi:hypothetical protein